MSVQVLTRRCVGAVKPARKQLGRAFISEFDKHFIGKREVVGYGRSGQPNYVDRWDIPFPAIRYKEPTADVLALREKEKGDWRKLSFEEKRQLYRASFCQTFAEFQAPTGTMKTVIGGLFTLFGVAFWLFYYIETFVTNIPLPESFNEENRRVQLRRLLDLHNAPIEGIASWWDYENDRWK